jgi:hypothetical protein
MLIPNLHKALLVGSNRMTDNLIIEKAISELQTKSFGTTQQFLEVHEIEYADNKPKVLRVDTDQEDGTAIVYFAIKGEKFYLAVYLDTSPEVAVRHVGTEPYHSVYFRATSETMNFEQLASLTKLKATNGWNRGDNRKFGNSYHKNSSIHFEPNPEPDEFEDKLMKLLNYLEQDRQGITELVDTANGYIQVATVFHNGNTMLGGHHLDKQIIKRLGALNLKIDFDLYAEGNFFKD